MNPWKRIAELEAELKETIRSHQKQNKVCEEWEQENDRLENCIFLLEQEIRLLKAAHLSDCSRLENKLTECEYKAKLWATGEERE
jgi:hypothetical protein